MKFSATFLVLAAVGMVSGCGKTEQEPVALGIESQLFSEGYPSTELMAHLETEIKTEVVDFGLTSFHQRGYERRMDSLHVERIVEVELPPGDYSSAHIVKPGLICAVDGIHVQVPCYSVDSKEWVTLGGGKGEGPSEVRILNGFAYSETDGSYLVFDGQRNIAKILDSRNVYRQEIFSKSNILNPTFWDEQTVLFNPIAPLREEPAILRWDLKTNELHPFAYLQPSELGAHILAIGAPYLTMKKVGGDRLAVAYWYWGVISLYDGSGNRLVTRSMIRNRHDRPNYFREMLGAPNVFYQERYTRNYRWTHAFSVDDRYLINVQMDTDRKTYLDFYDKERGEYQFSAYFRREGSTIKIDIAHGLIVNLTGDGILQIYRYRYL